MSAIVTLPASQWTEEELDQDSFAVLTNGKHHVLVTRVKNDEKKHQLLFDYLVLNSTAKENRGLATREYFSYNGGRMRALWSLATRMGYRRRGESMGAMRIDWETMVNRTIIVETKQEETEDANGQKTGKYRSPWTFSGFWLPDDDRVRDVPRGRSPQPGAAPTNGFHAETISAADAGEIPD